MSLLKGALILAAACAVGVQILWRLGNPALSPFEGMGIAALLNFGANLVCLKLLTPYRSGEVNLASAWSAHATTSSRASQCWPPRYSSDCSARAGLTS